MVKIIETQVGLRIHFLRIKPYFPAQIYLVIFYVQ